jgi:Raf kinase inhibitor-like YbhB/YbcL family protein
MMRAGSVATIVVAIALVGACGDGGDGGDGASEPTASGSTVTTARTPASIVVTSEAFNEGEPIPVKYTCEGANVSPALDWSGTPFGTESIAVVVDDPDAPGGTFVHWVVVNLPVGSNMLGEQASGIEQLANSRGERAWTGPCPPPGESHRYRFTVYALPAPLQTTDTAEALPMIEETALAHGRLTGTFQR